MLGPGRGPGVWCLCFALQQLSPCHPATFYCLFLYSLLSLSFYFIICPTMSMEYDALFGAYIAPSAVYMQVVVHAL